jgi:putative cardiolipin synthase
LAEQPEYKQGQDGFLLLGSGLDAFVARAALAEVAELSIDVQYYLYHNDEVSALFTGVLWKAADRGVRVRLLVDDMDMEGRDVSLIMLDNHPNIEIRIFNPFDRSFGRMPQFVTGLGSLTRRMHNKSFTVDNTATIVGGRNIGNEYFDANPTLEFADLDVMAVGDSARQVSRSFDEYWNSELAYPVTTIIYDKPSDEEIVNAEARLKDFLQNYKDSEYIKALGNSNLAQQIRNNSETYYWGKADVVVDHPDKITSSRDANELHLMTQLAPHFSTIKDELIIVSPYFVPGHEGVEFFKKLVEKGVRVRILTNSLSSNDVGVVHAGYSVYREDLLRNGVELYEMNKKLTRSQRKEKKGVGGSSKASLHAKTFVMDRDKVFIGSLNLDPRSFYENSEIGLVIHSTEIAEDMVEALNDDFDTHAFRLELVVDEDGDESILWYGYEDGQPVTFDVDPYTSVWRRFGVGFMSLFPIESQL